MTMKAQKVCRTLLGTLIAMYDLPCGGRGTPGATHKLVNL